MNNDISATNDYRLWLQALKERIRRSQTRVATSANSELLHLYWQMGSDIVEKQKHAKWGDGLLTQLSRDLTEEFPNAKGFTVRNLQRMRKWYAYYSDAKAEIATQPVSQFESAFFSVPWGHHIMVMQRSCSIDEAIFYIQQTVENNWSRSTLDWQIDSRLYERQGMAVTNFERTLPAPQGDLAQQLTKDPYVIDLMGIRDDMEEREIEDYLNAHISRFLLELGKGFTFYGRQVHLNVGGDDFYIDLLFYHVKLHCYVVVELKAVKFKPEHIGQLKFYVTAVDQQMRTEHDNPTIGLLICKKKNDIVAEYTLHDVDAPIGISSMQAYEKLMEGFKSELPTVEEIEKELKD